MGPEHQQAGIDHLCEAIDLLQHRTGRDADLGFDRIARTHVISLLVQLIERFLQQGVFEIVTTVRGHQVMQGIERAATDHVGDGKTRSQASGQHRRTAYGMTSGIGQIGCSQNAL